MDHQNEWKTEYGMATENGEFNDEQNSEEIKKRPILKPLRRGLPAELMDEMFACLPLENAYGLLAEMPNGLLARKVRKMLKSVKMAMKNNKWDSTSCRKYLRISGDGLVIKNPEQFGKNFVQAFLPMPKFNINAKSIFYFEVKILEKKNSFWNDANIFVGFSFSHTPKGIWLGKVHNSFRIWYRARFRLKESFIEFENADKYFQAGDVIGLGIIHFGANWQMKCFATSNGELLGMTKLPNAFSTFQLFPALTLGPNDSVRANFGQEKWSFNPDKVR